jgi:hypothetical protein
MEKRKISSQSKATSPADENGNPQIDATQLAILAALLDPKTCESDRARSALFHAIALWEESVMLCNQLNSLNSDARLTFAGREPDWNSGATHLIRALARKHDGPLVSEALPDRRLEMKFDAAVRQITGQPRSERAMPIFREWVATSVRKEDVGEEIVRLRREMTTVDLECMTESFAIWHERRRSEINKANAKKRQATAKKNLKQKAKKRLVRKSSRKS